MGIQSSVNALMQQLYTIGAIGAGLRQQRGQLTEAKTQTKEVKKQTEKIENYFKSVEEKYKNYKGVPSDSVLHPAQLKAVQEADDVYQHTGYELDPKTIDGIAIRNSFIEQEELKNEVAGLVAKMSVKARTDSINQTKSNFDEHVASLIRYYGKGSGNP